MKWPLIMGVRWKPAETGIVALLFSAANGAIAAAAGRLSGGGAGSAALLTSGTKLSSSLSSCFSYMRFIRACSINAAVRSSCARREWRWRARWRFCEMPSTRRWMCCSTLLASSSSSSASSTRSGRIFELALSRSIFRRLAIVLFTAS